MQRASGRNKDKKDKKPKVYLEFFRAKVLYLGIHDLMFRSFLTMFSPF